MPGTLLSPLAPSDRADVISAYNVLLRLQNKILADIKSAQRAREEAERSLMYCRIVGHFFHHVPSATGRNHLVQEVSATEENEQKLLDLGELYYNYALRVFRSTEEWTPSQSRHAPHPLFDNEADLIKAKLIEAPESYQTVKKQGESRFHPAQFLRLTVLKALVRDRFRCLISGVYDMECAMEYKGLLREPGAVLAVIECTHIFSESKIANVSEGSKKTAWAVLSRLGGFQKLVDKLNVHRLENVMTLDGTVHFLFDTLQLWLEPTSTENKYYVRGSINPVVLRQYPTVVEFTTPDPVNLPLPSRDYLALHAACAKVAHLSAAAEYMDPMFTDMEDMLEMEETKGDKCPAVLEHMIKTVH